MKTSQTQIRRHRFAVAVTTLLVLGATATTAWVLAPRASSSPVEISETLSASANESMIVSWPENGAAAMAVGDGTISASSGRALPMASISKLITALMILEMRPLNSGDQGESFEFTWDDENAYFEALREDKSAVPVPVGGTLTEYQMLEGILVGSACNYVDYLVAHLWGSNDDFVNAANSFLERHGLTDITMVEPTGIDPRNTATPAALIEVARLALANPVIAEIVAKRVIDLPGVGPIENTNDLLADTGVVGLKTGTLDGYNLLTAKDITIADGSTIRVFVVVMNQPSDEERFSATRALYDQVETFAN